MSGGRNLAHLAEPSIIVVQNGAKVSQNNNIGGKPKTKLTAYERNMLRSLQNDENVTNPGEGSENQPRDHIGNILVFKHPYLRTPDNNPGNCDNL